MKIEEVISWRLINAAIRWYQNWKRDREEEPKIGDLCYFTRPDTPDTWAIGNLRGRHISMGMVIYLVGNQKLSKELQEYPFTECRKVTEKEAIRIGKRRTRKSSAESLRRGLRPKS